MATGNEAAHVADANTLRIPRISLLPLWIQGRQLDVKTEASYRQSISWWSRLTRDPPLDQITDHTVASFIARLCKQPGRSGTMMMSSVKMDVHGCAVREFRHSGFRRYLQRPLVNRAGYSHDANPSGRHGYAGRALRS